MINFVLINYLHCFSTFSFIHCFLYKKFSFLKKNVMMYLLLLLLYKCYVLLTMILESQQIGLICLCKHASKKTCFISCTKLLLIILNKKVSAF